MKKSSRKVVVKRTEAPKPMRNTNRTTVTTMVRYAECMRNHAVGVGGHAVDGCMEFMACGDEGSAVYTCVACGCHRNFHRKEVHTEVVSECNSPVRPPPPPPPPGAPSASAA